MGELTHLDVLDLYITHQPKAYFTPNQDFMYCNAGYIFLALIIEKVSGISYSEYLDRNLFKPLNMNHSLVYNTRRTSKELINNYAVGLVYNEKLKKYELPDTTMAYSHVVYQDAIVGDGCVNSTILDLQKWESELYYPKLIQIETLNLAFENSLTQYGTYLNYGYGFFLSGGNESEKLVFHTGGWPGYFCIIMHFPDLEKSIIILSNNSFDDFTKMANEIAYLTLYL